MSGFALIRVVLVTAGLLCLSAFLWFAGPYFAFGEYRPLASIGARVAAMTLLFLGWLARALLRRRHARHATDRLINAVVEQDHAAPTRADEDVERLRQRFEEEVAELRRQQTGHSLYDLPWYVVIGAPGSGKTTALVNSGLKFPVKQRTGRAALRGIGGTRDCDWWFTDDAVLLDTAGRFTTQDSDSIADRAGWLGFLELLCQYRKRRPVNGVVLAISVEELVADGVTLETHASLLRRRLGELKTALTMRLPVYVLVTKCDLVAGFVEYFDDLTPEPRAQVWGTTFSEDLTSGSDVARAFSDGFEGLVSRLNARVYARVDQERDPSRRSAMFAFPQQMSALHQALSTVLSEVFGAARFDQQVILRGVYFTSGTQEGTPIDRLLGQVARRFSAPSDAVAAGERGKAYFIERVLKDVMFAESGLAGVSHQHERHGVSWRLATYGLLVLVAVGGVSLLWTSYVTNRDYLAAVAEDIARLEDVPSVLPDAVWTPQAVLPRLDLVSEVSASANRYQEVPWTMRWGLFQGGSLGRAALDAYVRELDGALLPQVHAQVERRLSQIPASEFLLYEYLKAYVMLGQPEHLDKAQLQVIAHDEWQRGVPDTAQRLAQHFATFLGAEETPRAMPLDESLVAAARNSIASASLPGIMYRRLRLEYAADLDRSVRLDLDAGPGADQVFRRRSGTPLSEPVNSLFTREVFHEVTGRSTGELVSRYSAEDWVWGDPARGSQGDAASLEREVLDLYEQRYIEAWSSVVADIALVPVHSGPAVEGLLARLSTPTSPLRGLLDTIDTHTHLVEPSEADDGPGVFRSALERAREAAGYRAPARAGQLVTDHFSPIHELVSSGAVDDVLNQLRSIQQQMVRIGPDVGRIPPGDPSYLVVVDQIRSLVESLKLTAERLPPAIGNTVTEAGDRAVAVSASGVGVVVRDLYQREVRPLCEASITRYPLAADAVAELSLDEFGRLFGYGGVYDRFFDQQLEPLVDVSRVPWAWRTGAGVGDDGTMLREFAQAARIRSLLFVTGSAPQVPFTLQLRELDAPSREFAFDVDGQSLMYLRGAPRRVVPMVWPGPDPRGVSFSFDQTQYQPPDGVWGWFRLIEGPLAGTESPHAALLTMQAGPRRATVRVESAPPRDLFAGLTALRQFRCGAAG